MKQNHHRFAPLTVVLALTILSPVSAQTTDGKPIEQSNLIGTQTLTSPIGTLEIDNTYPTDQTTRRLYELRDLQRAVELYLWGLPIVQFQAWKDGQEKAFGEGFTVYTTLKEHTGIITSNATTPYIFGWPNLKETGPLVIEMPAGQYASAIMDWWEYPVCDMGLSGPDKGKGGTYIIVGPGEDLKNYEGKADYLFQSRTNKLSVGFRVLEPGEAALREFMKKVKVYPLGSKAAVPRFAYKLDKEWSGTPKLGLGYFEMLHKAIQDEPVRDRDKAFMSWLRYFGIEDGKPFSPSERNAKILAQGANMGELVARANAMEPYFSEPYWEGTQWYRLIDFPVEQEDDVRYYVDERAAWFYEAVTTTKGMKTETPGVGQIYLSAKRDKDGEFLKGGEHYKLHIPADAPYEQFWSLTPYSEHTRGLIRSKITEFIDANRDSRDQRLKYNEDGSVDLYFGPDESKVPEDRKGNWMMTNLGEGWFPYFRLYAPKREFFDKTWRMPDIEKVR
jgi:hypothetical protein